MLARCYVIKRVIVAGERAYFMRRRANNDAARARFCMNRESNRIALPTFHTRHLHSRVLRDITFPAGVALGSIRVRDCLEIPHPDLQLCTRLVFRAASHSARQRRACDRRITGGSEGVSRENVGKRKKPARRKGARGLYRDEGRNARTGRRRREGDTGTYDYTPSRTIMVARPCRTGVL